MPLKTSHPKNNDTIKQKLIVIQGKCDNLPKVTATLTKNGQVVQGQKLGNNAKQFGILYKNLADGSYHFAIDQTNSPVISDAVDFNIKSMGIPPAGTSPNVTAPATGDEVAVTFYPYGTSSANIDTIVFSGNGQNINGTVTQQPDADGNWVGQVDGIDKWPNGPHNLYRLDVTNVSGTTTVNSLTIAAP